MPKAVPSRLTSSPAHLPPTTSTAFWLVPTLSTCVRPIRIFLTCANVSTLTMFTTSTVIFLKWLRNAATVSTANLTTPLSKLPTSPPRATSYSVAAWATWLHTPTWPTRFSSNSTPSCPTRSLACTTYTPPPIPLTARKSPFSSPATASARQCSRLTPPRWSESSEPTLTTA